MKRRCPVCRRIIEVSVPQALEKQEYYPFCSERCKLIDLGDWLDVKYRITPQLRSENAGEPADSSPDSIEDKR